MTSKCDDSRNGYPACSISHLKQTCFRVKIYRVYTRKTVKWETENPIYLKSFYPDREYTRYSQKLYYLYYLLAMRGIEIFQKQSYREITLMQECLM